jgi:Universal stress protein UspA and related nucleotide-binding proteins
MKKIIAAIDAMHFSEKELLSFQYIARKANGDIKAVFLENIIGQDIYLANAYPEGGGFSYEEIYDEILEEREKRRKENLERFHRYSDNSETKITLQEATGSPVAEVINESRFADLLLINNNTSFAALRNTNPPKFVKDVLAEAQCPVIVMPEKISAVKEILLAYNGSFSSMYAIKQFTQLFPDLSHLPVNVIYVVEKENSTMPQEKQLKEYLEHHYKNVTYSILTGEPAAEFLALLMHRRECIVTFGAYGRSRLSRFFHNSEAESILRAVNVPLFITHP